MTSLKESETVPSCKLTKKIDSPPSAVFALFSDFANAAGRIEAIKKLEVITPGPIGVGTRFKETRVMFKKECTEEMEITAFDPPRSYEVGCQSCGADFRTLFRFTPEGSGTNVEVDFTARATTFWAKLFTPLSLLMMGSMKKCFEKDLDDLKKAAEGTLVA